MNKRNLQQFQPTIPRNWLEEVGLKEGDRVNLLRDAEDRLILVPEKHEQTS
ncbi:MAG: AbrB/MazE/SpoVT family DNA-binding domain-containing protein [Patescibacteria group bacterium]|nr:AbrB/MazE/SpoVT family DNA-binding domain-containing protein [Patescibacteria group bacterium]